MKGDQGRRIEAGRGTGSVLVRISEDTAVKLLSLCREGEVCSDVIDRLLDECGVDLNPENGEAL